MSLRQEKTKNTNLSKYGCVMATGNPEIRAKSRATSIKKYGAPSWTQSDYGRSVLRDKAAVTDYAVRNKKSQATNLARYGVLNPMQNSDISRKTAATLSSKSPEEWARIKNKASKTYKRSTGFVHPLKNPEVKQQVRVTYKAKTGYDHNMRNPAHKQKRRELHMAVYGVGHPSQRSEVKEKTRQTALWRYGGLGLGSVLTRSKIEKTNLARYGTKVPTSNPDVMDKCKASWLKIYGFTNPNKNPEQANKGLLSSLARHDTIINGKRYTVQGKSELKALHFLLKKYGKVETQFSEKFPRKKARALGWTPDFYVSGVGFFECKSLWTLCMPSALKRNIEKAAGGHVIWIVVVDSVVVVLDKDWYENLNLEYAVMRNYYEQVGIERYCQSYMQEINAQLRGVIKAQTVLVKDRKLVVCFRPTYWSQSKDEVLRHMAKAQQHGWRLIYLQEHTLRKHRRATNRFLRNLVGQASGRVGARECTVVVKKASEVSDFLHDNHLQGPVRSGVAYCLVQANTVKAAMVFNKTISNRGSSEVGGFELTRYATSCTVPGGASRLLAAFLRATPSAESVVSYCDRSTFTGVTYEKLGFTKTASRKTNYYAWIRGLDIRPKQAYAKSNLSKLPGFDPALTERVNCARLSLPVIHTIGSDTYTLKVKR